LNLQALIEYYGYLAIFVGCLLEGETVLVLGAVSAHLGYLKLPWVIAIAAVAGFLGDQLWFLVGRRYGPAAYQRFPRIAKHAREASERLDRNADWVVMLMRFMVGMRTAIPIAVGAGRMSHARFVALNAVGAVLWATTFGVAGYVFGAAVTRSLDKALHEAEIVLGIALVAMAVYFAVRYLRARQRAASGKQQGAS
jgi:membrane protein DedA with SNARE-associated domain